MNCVVTVQTSMFGSDQVISSPGDNEESPSKLSRAGEVALEMYRVIRKATGQSPRDAFNTLVRIFADLVRLAPLPTDDHSVANRITPLIPAFIKALEAEPFFDPLGEVFSHEKLGGEGQVLTPRWLVEYLLQQTVEADLKDKSNSRQSPFLLLDPAVGTGRFLIVAAEKYGGRYPLVLFGVELDLDLYRACLVNMRFFPHVLSFVLWGDALLLDLAPSSPNWAYANRWNPVDWRRLKPITPDIDLKAMPVNPYAGHEAAHPIQNRRTKHECNDIASEALPTVP